ncbi:UNVERIFIED_CONTAM: hypothetical protein Slati_0964800 [Sesamum latifolium]|uniref:Uncharacterized protein n=1 Tax=Sesamum latifolium TaxID=2727402 RepID=A0AAW2XU35_9LAMI
MMIPISVETPVAPNVAMHRGDVEQMNWDQMMVYDAARPHFFSAHPNPEPVGALRAVDHPLYNGCDESQISAVARLVNIKAKNNISERCYDQMSQYASDLSPHDHTLPSNYYNMKKLIRDLGLPVEKIHACKNGCMCIGRTTSGSSTASSMVTLGTNLREIETSNARSPHMLSLDTCHRFLDYRGCMLHQRRLST